MIRPGDDDFLLMTFDTLRYDVAQTAWQNSKTPNLNRWLPSDGWEQRHSPGSFTFAAHAAFFAGFLPTPTGPGRHSRRLGLKFEGSETLSDDALVLDAPDIVSGFEQLGYHTICIGGVGFFNKQNPLGSVLPSLFHESHWSPSLGVTEFESTRNQFVLTHERLERLPNSQRVFLFINLSAMHHPNCIYRPGVQTDGFDTQLAALEYVDSQLPLLMNTLSTRGSGVGVWCSDHGTAYGEDEYWGHRLAHPVVWNVPYAEVKW